MKVIAFYLPQYHTIPENDEWWGKGFTEWVNIKNAKPLFRGHYQPRIPKDHIYYDLLNDDVKRWQVNLARDNGIYGFCFYHYWFDGHLLLEKPTEQFLADPTLNLPFCLCWANEPWTKAWVSKHDTILINQKYGSEEQWKKHFNYLLPYFKDERYIKNEGKPMFVIYRPNEITNLNKMLDFWQILAKEEGFPGICFSYQQIDMDLQPNSDTSRFTYNIEFQPVYAIEDISANQQKLTRFLKSFDRIWYKVFRFKLSDILMKRVRKHDYDAIWHAVLKHQPKNDKCLPGVFVDWDNTPRRKEKGRVFDGAHPSKFKKYFKEQIIHTKEDYHKEMIFLTAWNEWSEGCYLEPDEKFGLDYLTAIREALLETDEFPVYPSTGK